MRFIAVASVLAVAFATAHVQAAAQYSVTNLGSEFVSGPLFNGQYAYRPVDGLRIGAGGEVVAIASDGNLLIYRGGAVERVSSPVSTFISVLDVNANGDVLISGGMSTDSDYTLYRNGTFVPYAPAAGNVFRINDAGVGVGADRGGNPLRVGVGANAVIAGLPTGSYPLAINNGGLIAARGAFDGSGYPIVLLDGDTLYHPTGVSGYDSFVHGLNESGTGIGWVSDGSGRNSPVVFDRTSIRKLGVPPYDQPVALTWEINEAGDIVGEDFVGMQTGRRAILWRNEVAFDLNDLVELPADHHLIAGMDINDAGQIIVWGTDGQPEYPWLPTPYAAYLLTPIPVPEPTVTIILAPGMLLVAYAARRATRRRCAGAVGDVDARRDEDAHGGRDLRLAAESR